MPLIIVGSERAHLAADVSPVPIFRGLNPGMGRRNRGGTQKRVRFRQALHPMQIEHVDRPTPTAGVTASVSCHPLRWLWGLIPVLMLSWIAVDAEADRIERDLETRARVALADAGHDWASIAFSGREGMIVGTPPDASQSVEAVRLVSALWGVRTVSERNGVGVADNPVSETVPLRELPALPMRKPTIVAMPAAASISATPTKAATMALPNQEVPRKIDAVMLPEVHPPPVENAGTGSAGPVAVPEVGPDIVPASEPSSTAVSAAQQSQEELATISINTATLTSKVADASNVCATATERLGAMQPVKFSLGKARLDAPSRAFLDRLAAVAGPCPVIGFKIAGHADAMGGTRRNQKLSERRARSVAGYLRAKGIDAGRLKAVGYGETRPLAPNDTAQNRARNRRIEVEITEISENQHGSGTTGQGTGNGLSDR
jgi:outer membrane protein OmpA-like peptidoglycan-associated protein